MPKPRRASELKKMAGLRLKAARLVLGMSTQDSMANFVGAGLKAYNSWENGSRMPDVAAVVRLWEQTGIGPDWIFAGSLRGVPFDYAMLLQQRAAELGAVVGGATAEWPMAVARLQAGRPPAAVPRRERQRPTLHEAPTPLKPGP